MLVANGNSLPSDLGAAVAKAGGKLTGSLPQIGVAFATSTSADFASTVKSAAGLRSVDNNPSAQWIGPASGQSIHVNVGNPPNSGSGDFFFDLQWGHDAIDAPEAWDAGFKGHGARVAVIDTGFDLDHPDLVPNINFALSKNFVPGEDLGYGLPDPFSHGTHTAGTVAAAENNFGTIGVAPEAELMLLKGLPDGGCGSDQPILQALAYAADNGADVISMSLGDTLEKSGYVAPGCSDGPEDDVFVSASEVAETRHVWARAVKYALDKGATVIASAGNEALDANHTADVFHLPSDAPGVLSISATGPFGWAVDPTTNLDEPAIYTNFGQSAISLAAPGGNLDEGLAASGQLCTVTFVTVPCFAFDFVFSTGSSLDPANPAWFWSAGTSMAAPHVAGVAALIIGKNGGSMSPVAVARALEKGADHPGKPGNDPFFGAGRVNAFNSVR